MHRPDADAPALELPRGRRAPRPPRRERNAAVTRERLLDAAEREFAALGFAGARLREIASGAGVQPALIHHYFDDKEGLYRAVLDRALVHTSAASWSLLERHDDIEGLVDGFIDLLLRFFAEHAESLGVLRHEATRGTTVMADVIRERSAAVVEAVKTNLEARQRRGELRGDIAASEMIVLALSMTAYSFMDAATLEAIVPSGVPRDEDALARRRRAIVSALLQGLCRRADPTT